MKNINQWTIPDSIYDSHVHMDSSKNYSEEINFWLEQMERYNVDKITVLTRDSKIDVFKFTIQNEAIQ